MKILRYGLVFFCLFLGFVTLGHIGPRVVVACIFFMVGGAVIEQTGRGR